MTKRLASDSLNDLNYEVERTEFNQKKADINAQKVREELQALKDALSERRIELEQARAQNNARVNELNSVVAQLNQDLANLRQENARYTQGVQDTERLQNEVAILIDQQTSKLAQINLSLRSESSALFEVLTEDDKKDAVSDYITYLIREELIPKYRTILTSRGIAITDDDIERARIATQNWNLDRLRQFSGDMERALIGFSEERFNQIIPLLSQVVSISAATESVRAEEEVVYARKTGLPSVKKTAPRPPSPRSDSGQATSKIPTKQRVRREQSPSYQAPSPPPRKVASVSDASKRTRDDAGRFDVDTPSSVESGALVPVVSPEDQEREQRSKIQATELLRSSSETDEEA